MDIFDQKNIHSKKIFWLIYGHSKKIIYEHLWLIDGHF